MNSKTTVQRQNKHTYENVDNKAHSGADFLPQAPAYGTPTPQMLQPLVFVGLQAIAKAVGAGHLALRRWIREENFPARRCSDGIYRAEPEAIRQWFRTIKQ
ncbi:hypothetical protein [Desulfovibrio cuneatus]|uniref:hypothetical protein n=1 Tax=Desulfovibrio cuneatus TaxID=159728 RepID=UPI00041545C1|nr:hypothetical protein [Desulfovibrio cuneatus]